MKNGRNIFTIRKSTLFRGAIGIVTVFLIMVKLTSPFLHTHQFEESSSKSVNISSLHCEACEYETTQAVEAGTAIILPTNLFAIHTEVYETVAVFVSATHSSAESRGPPQIL